MCVLNRHSKITSELQNRVRDKLSLNVIRLKTTGNKYTTTCVESRRARQVLNASQVAGKSVSVVNQLLTALDRVNNYVCHSQREASHDSPITLVTVGISAFHLGN